MSEEGGESLAGLNLFPVECEAISRQTVSGLSSFIGHLAGVAELFGGIEKHTEDI